VMFTLTFGRIKLSVFLEIIPPHKHEVRGTTNMLGHPTISVCALKGARLRIEQESVHFEQLF